MCSLFPFLLRNYISPWSLLTTHTAGFRNIWTKMYKSTLNIKYLVEICKYQTVSVALPCLMYVNKLKLFNIALKI